MAEDLKKMYRTIMDDHFPHQMEISFVDDDRRQTLFYEKVTWAIDGVEKGLRYGENPGQEAALYKLVNGNLVLGEIETIAAGAIPGLGHRAAAVRQAPRQDQHHRCRQRPEHPALPPGPPHGGDRQAQQPLRRGPGADTLADAYHKANMADRVAAFGGCIALNRAVDKATAEPIVGPVRRGGGGAGVRGGRHGDSGRRRTCA